MNERNYSQLPLLDLQEPSATSSNRMKTKPKSYLRLSPWTSWKRRFVVFPTLVLIALVTILWWMDADLTKRNDRLQTSSELTSIKKQAQKKPPVQTEKLSVPQGPAHELRYLSYLPHSGFHNQRIALENALTLAKVLNRTLIIPPCILGTAIPWVEFDKLLNRLRTISSIGYEDCYSSEDSEQMVSSRECLSQPQGTWVGWKEIINMDEIRKSVKIIERKSFEEDWLFKRLGIKKPAGKIQQIKEGTIYQYKFLVRPSRKKAGKKVAEKKVELGKFDTFIDVYEHFGNSDANLIEIGSLFGTSRLKITNDPLARQARSEFRRAMVFNNPVLDKLSRRIASQLFHPPTGYLGVHVRVGDNLFRSHASETVSTIINKMVTDHLKLPLSTLQEALRQSDLQDYRRQSAMLVSDQPHVACRGPKHTKPNLLKFNQPLFLATDSPLPQVEPALKTFFKAFPCTYLLNDFQLSSINDIRLSEDHQAESDPAIGKLMIPFLDAMVAARATSFVGTPGSTFSDFVNNVLFQNYHNLSIIEFG
ncbi:uncharacterized protein PGTG_14442 [Puccinia graminis f. sp. tritici CRL 75-36-700-3]|uniref:O-fucosyltransferase family protein n=1 Tax=Puccinia graminis f. sp. tritici (strain CRL 75-36-700-3 / race SCCL) TaxID=418459 RepID=E3KVL8_PUCGT|nr:uncharacterized protein PGTG_14442 [Puccinia graminis f. sp. tritici CRL 75-36-700-3]EFP88358.2 hypothetical protein PGTG_14442 [Puccinia graminis f. sp. tritici CRL 75-36-700-3]